MNIIDYSIIFVYLAGLLVMGRVLKNQTNKSDYFLGGRSMGWFPLSLSVMATQLSAISFVSAPAFVGLRPDGGLKWLTYEFAVPLAMIFLMWKLLPMLYRANVVSIYDYLEQRFNRSTRLLLSFVFQLSRSFATGIMVYAVSIILQGTMGIELWQSIVLIGLITVIYSLEGGMKAVVYGDALQMVIIVLGTIICAYYGLVAIGGLDEFKLLVDPQRLQVINFKSLGVNGDEFGFLPMLFGGFVLYASYYGCDQSQAQRSLSASNENQIRKILLANGLLRFPITLLYCFSGLVIGVLAFNTPEFLAQIPEDHPDWMVPIFIINYLPHGLIGLLVVAILAAAMSSLSSAINSLSAVSVEDYCQLTAKKLDDKQYMSFAKLAGLAWGVVVLCMSFFAGSIAPTIIEAINLVGSVFYGAILAVFVIAISNKKITALHVNTGIMIAITCNIMLKLMAPQIFWFWYNVVGFVVTLLVAYFLSALLKPKQVIDSTTVVPESAETKLDMYYVTILLGVFGLMLLLSLYIPTLMS